MSSFAFLLSVYNYQSRRFQLSPHASWNRHIGRRHSQLSFEQRKAMGAYVPSILLENDGAAWDTGGAFGQEWGRLQIAFDHGD